MELAIFIGGYLSSSIAMLLRMNWYNDFEDTKAHYPYLLNFLKIPHTGAKRNNWRVNLKDHEVYKVSYLYAFLFPIIYPAALAKFIYTVTFKKQADKIAKAKELKKKYTTNDIYDFERNDLIILKDGKTVMLDEFSLIEFSDSDKNIYSWVEAKSNMSFEKRKINFDKTQRYNAFKEGAEMFDIQRKQFKKELDAQRNLIIDRIESSSLHTKNKVTA